MDPRPKGRRPAGGLDPRPKGRRPAAEPDLPPTGKRPAALLDPRPMEEEARVLPTLPSHPVATLNTAGATAAPESDGVLGWSISLVKFPGKIEEYMETAVDLARKIHSRAPSTSSARARPHWILRSSTPPYNVTLERRRLLGPRATLVVSRSVGASSSAQFEGSFCKIRDV